MARVPSFPSPPRGRPGWRCGARASAGRRGAPRPPAGTPPDRFARRVCRTSPGMRDHDRLPTEPQRIARHDRPVGHVRVGEARHLRRSDHQRPRRFGGLATLLVHPGRHVGMRDRPGPGPAQHHRAEVMIGVMVRQHQPPDRLARDGADDTYQLLALSRACERIDYHHAVAGHDEAGVRPALRSSPRVTHNHVDAGCQLADGKALGEWREDLKQQERSQMKRMSTDCWNTPPLLSFHTNFSAASRSARKENSTNGSRLMPELQTKCAASRSPYVTLTSLMK